MLSDFTTSTRRWRTLAFAGCGLVALAMLLGGCAGADFLESARDAMRRAFRYEQPEAFFQPVIEQIRDGEVTTEIPVQARQYYLQAVAWLERLNPRMREELRREGTLGDALTIKALAQWRLERLDDAERSIEDVRTCGQEALRSRERAMLTALEGVIQINKALAADKAGKPFPEIFELIAGKSGAWRTLGLARTQLDPTQSLQLQIQETRLAAYKVLVDARNRDPENAHAIDPESIARQRAEAQSELRDFARNTSATGAAAHSSLVRRWQLLCGLDPVGN